MRLYWLGLVHNTQNMIVEAPKKLHISDIRKLFLIYTCFDIVTMSSSVESEKTGTWARPLVTYRQG